MKLFSKSSNRPKKYRVASDKLQPGDIILTRNDYPLSNVIRYAANNPPEDRYSHAILYICKGYAMEATKNGVFGLNPLRIIESNRSDIIVLRSKIAITYPESKILESWARSMVGQNYSTHGAARAGLYNKLGIDIKNLENDGQFCSKFVAEAYRFAGLDYFGNSGLETPTSLINENFFILPDMVVDHVKVDGVDVESEGDFTVDLFSNLFSEFNKKVYSGTAPLKTFSEVISFLYRNPSFDGVFADVFKGSGYNKFVTNNLHEEAFGNSFSFLMEMSVESDSGKDKATRLALEIIRNPDSAFQNDVLNMQTYIEILDQNPGSEYSKAMVDFYKKMIESQRSTISEAICFLCKIGRWDLFQNEYSGMALLDDLAFEVCQMIMSSIRFSGEVPFDLVTYVDSADIQESKKLMSLIDSSIDRSGICDLIKYSNIGEDIWESGMSWEQIKNMACYTFSYESASLKQVVNKTKNVQRLIDEIDDFRDRIFSTYMKTMVGSPQTINTNKERKMPYSSDLAM